MKTFAAFLKEDKQHDVIVKYGFQGPKHGDDGHDTYIKDGSHNILLDYSGNEWHFMDKGVVQTVGNLDDNSLSKFLQTKYKVKGVRVLTSKGAQGVVTHVQDNGLLVVKLDSGSIDIFRPDNVEIIPSANQQGTSETHRCEASIEGKYRQCQNKGTFVPGFGWVCSAHQKSLRK